MRQRRNAHSRIWIGTSVEFFSPEEFRSAVRRPSEYLTIVGIFHDSGEVVRYPSADACGATSLIVSTLRMLSEANSGCGIIIALLSSMKTNPVSVRKVALLLATICAVMLASVSQVRADRHPLPPTGVAVPDSGATVMLLGAALGALGMARRFLRKP